MMVLNKSETIKELEAAYVKFAKQSKEFYALESELRSKIQNASSSEEAALLREALSKEIRYILDQLIYLKYCSPNLKYFDLPLDEKVIDEHFNKFSPPDGGPYSDLWDDLFSYDYHMDKLIKSGVKQPNLFYYADAYHPYYLEWLLRLIKKVVKFRFVNGICNTSFHSNNYHYFGSCLHPPISDDYFFYPFFEKESFCRTYSLPLYHLLPKQVATELHNFYIKSSNYIITPDHSIPEPIRKYTKHLVHSNTFVDYYAYSLSSSRVFPYVVNLSAKYFAYNIARFLVKNVLFLPKKLSLDTSTFILDFPDALNIKDVSKAVLSRTVHYLDDIFYDCVSKDCSKENTGEHFYSFSFNSRSFKFRLVLSHSLCRLNYPYRSFYVPGCQESDEEFANKISIRDKFWYLCDTDVRDTPLYAFDEFVEPIDLITENNSTKEGEPRYMESDTDYILNMFISDIDYNNLKVNEPFSYERFEQQLEELKKKAVYGGTLSRNHYSFLIANTAFYQFEKYLEYELEQYKIKNNINYEQMLEERKEKEKLDESTLTSYWMKRLYR
jgi:hypothetical protein